MFWATGFPGICHLAAGPSHLAMSSGEPYRRALYTRAVKNVGIEILILNS